MNRPGPLMMLLMTVLVGAGGAALGAEGSDRSRVTDLGMRVADIGGKERVPFKLEAGRFSVLVFVMNDCPIANGYSVEIRRIFEKYSKRGAEGFVVYTDPDVSIEAVRKHAAEYGRKGYPVIFDRGQKLVEATGATRSPEAVVVGAGGEILYRGRIDNRYASLGRPRRKATVEDLRNALDEVLAGGKVSTPRTRAVGCYIPGLKRK